LSRTLKISLGTGITTSSTAAAGNFERSIEAGGAWAKELTKPTLDNRRKRRDSMRN